MQQNHIASCTLSTARGALSPREQATNLAEQEHRAGADEDDTHASRDDDSVDLGHQSGERRDAISHGSQYRTVDNLKAV